MLIAIWRIQSDLWPFVASHFCCKLKVVELTTTNLLLVITCREWEHMHITVFFYCWYLKIPPRPQTSTSHLILIKILKNLVINTKNYQRSKIRLSSLDCNQSWRDLCICKKVCKKRDLCKNLQVVIFFSTSMQISEWFEY